jgi:DNA invertase Pin-like site-specific DNA recombinase
MKITAYCRVSTEEQARDGLSLPSQEQRIRAYVAAFPDLELSGIVQETGSGKTLQRPKLAGALEWIDEGRSEGLIVVSLDRLTRSVRDMGELLAEHFETAALMCVQDHIDTRTAAGRLMINLLVSVSQWEREAIGERTSAVLRTQKVVRDGSANPLMAYRARVGKVANGRAPYGWAWFRGGLVPDPTEQKWVAWMLECRVQGRPVAWIRKELNVRQVPARSGGLWGDSQVRRILKAEWNNGTHDERRAAAKA